MTDLTEQWQKGELPEGLYYVKDSENIIAEYLNGYFYNHGEPMTSFSGGVDEVLDPVPSYKQWQKHRKTLLKTQEQNCNLEIINTQLKELLKDARNVLKMVDTYSGDYDSINGFLIVEKINQALGEDK